MSRRDDRAYRAAMPWDLTVGAPLVGGTDSAVYEVVDRAGRDLVLKCPHPDADAAAVTWPWTPSGSADFYPLAERVARRDAAFEQRPPWPTT